MNMVNNIMNRYILAFLPLVLVVACNGVDRMEAIELGVKEEACVLDCAPGEYYVDILSNGDYVAVIKTGDWLKFQESNDSQYFGSGDQRLCVEYDFNRGAERHATIEISRASRSVTVSLAQKGVLPSGIEFYDKSIEVGAEGGFQSVNLLSVYKSEDLLVNIDFGGNNEWITGVSKENNHLSFNVIGNASEDSRVAVLSVSSKENQAICDNIQIFQLGEGCEYEEKSFQAIKGMLPSAGEIQITDNWYFNSFVIGDDSEGNGGENMNISPILQDLTLSGRTAYVQNADASSGIKIIFDDGENITRRYDAVKMSLKGATLVCKGGGANDPVRYELRGVKASNIMSEIKGDGSILPTKHRRIDELKDEDLYTYVSIVGCEIPVRKGPFVPIDLRLASVIHSYPMLLLDNAGSTIYLMTNLTASWQRDGRPMPQGAGSVSGVIVHETCDNFEWSTEDMSSLMQAGVNADYVTGIGNIGAYQIRPFARNDINLAEGFQDSFSDLVMEILYYNADHEEIIKNVKDNTVYSTYPPVQDPLTDKNVRGVLQVFEDPGKQAGIAEWRDWTHLGPMDGNIITDPTRGNGVFDANGNSAVWSPASNVSTTGLVLNASGWYAGSNWGPAKYWIATFSTAATPSSPSLTKSNFPISVQFGAVSGLGQTVGAPRHWCVEYSTDQSDDWTQVETYTVPDFPILSNRKSWQCPGPKYISVTLPEDDRLLDNECVRVRLRPISTIAGSPGSYDGGKVINGRQTELNYFAIRYNK